MLEWLTAPWWALLPVLPAALCITAAALIAGAVIGSEREKRDKPAGLRTLIFVCLGATVFTMVGFCFSSETRDSGRVAAQIVTGIGFLGAGVMFHQRGGVSGATTAATIWVTASIGMTIGAGYCIAGVALSFLVRAVLVLVRAYERRFIERVHPVIIDVSFRPDHGKVRARLLRIFADFEVPEKECEWSVRNEDDHSLRANLRLAHRSHRELVEEIALLPGVSAISESTP
jgi:putative Mg2+ transporter-C (MgtC) family protein